MKTFLVFALLLTQLLSGACYAKPGLCTELFVNQQDKTHSERWEERSDYFSKLQTAVKEIEKDEQELSHLENASEFLALIQKLRDNSWDELNEVDLQFLKGRPKTFQLQKTIIFLADLLRYSTQMTAQTLEYWNLHPRPSYLNPKAPWLQAAARPVQQVLNLVLSILNPLSFQETKLDKIFQIHEKNPQTELSEESKKFIDKHNLMQEFQKRQAFAERHPRWMRFRRWVSKVTMATLLASNLLVINHDLHLSRHMISSDNYIAQVVPTQNQNQIDVYVDVSSFTHMAVAIDGKVYSYGVKNMDVVPIETYLSSSVGDRSLFPRSLQVVRVNLSLSERAMLKRDLERSALKNYKNITFVNDCATMIIRSLKRNTSLFVPQVVDASPSQFLMYLSMLNSLQAKNSEGIELINSEYQVAVDDPEYKIFHFLRNSYYNIVESNIFILNAPLIEGQKLEFNLTRKEKDVQWWNKQVQNQFEKWRAEQDQLIQENIQIRFIEAQLAQISASTKSQGDKQKSIYALEKYSVLFFRNEIQKAHLIEESSDSDLNDAFVAEFQVDALSKKQNEINQKFLKLKNSFKF